MATEQPPNYSYEDQPTTSSAGAPQLIITPAASAVQFQTGHLGVDGEHAALEGEVQLKGFRSAEWDSLTVTFKTTETALGQTIELTSSTVTLYSRKDASSSSTQLPSSAAFSIPLTADIPQAVETPVSSVSHSLTATLLPAGSSNRPFTKSIPIKIKRFTSPIQPSLTAAPRTLTFDEPTPVTVQLPRAVFRSGEMIPVYLTVPPPSRSVLEGRLQLRNVKTELIRSVRVGPVDAKAPEGVVRSENSKASQGVRVFDTPGPNEYPPEKATSVRPPTLLSTPSGSSSKADSSLHEQVVTRSGASCRFHSNRAVQLRLVLHTTGEARVGTENEGAPPDVDSAAGSITQSTLMHQVAFNVHVEVSFVTPATHTSTIVQGSIPIMVIPGLAEQPDQDDLQQSYMKKHDKPATKTTRMADDGAPPAFDDAGESIAGEYASSAAAVDPPPFSAEPSGGLPSFSESQAAASSSHSYAEPSGSSSHPATWREPAAELRFPGEGVQFGFPPEEQHDGLSHSFLVDSRSPPPAMDSSVNDQNLTAVAHLINPTSEQTGPGEAGSTFLPPPPPALDDPMDPPPSIDARFATLQIQPQVAPARGQAEPVAETPMTAGDGPPPYLGGAASASTAPPSYLDSR